VLNKINGLPAHVLLVHAVVVLFPLAAGMLVASAVSVRARRRLGWMTPALALVVLVLVPITTNAGHWLQRRLPATPAIDKHAALGDELLPWAIGIFVIAAAGWLLAGRYDMSWSPAGPPEPHEAGAVTDGGGGTATLTRAATAPTALRRLPTWATAIVAVLAIAVATGGVVQLVRIGDSGAKAVWGSTADLPDRTTSGGG
jgi:hypothetical protein